MVEMKDKLTEFPTRVTKRSVTRWLLENTTEYEMTKDSDWTIGSEYHDINVWTNDVDDDDIEEKDWKYHVGVYAVNELGVVDDDTLLCFNWGKRSKRTWLQMELEFAEKKLDEATKRHKNAVEAVNNLANEVAKIKQKILTLRG